MGKNKSLVTLVIEDQLAVRKQVAAALKSAGAGEVLEAASGEEGISIVRARGKEIELILCDLMLPDKDGIETLREIAETNTRAAVAIMSAADASLIRAAAKLALEHGLRLVGSLGKPVGAEQIQAVLHRVDARAVMGTAGHTQPLQVDEIAQALRDGRIFPFYQPIVNVQTREVVGFEALARWNDAQRGLLPAAEFIEVIESAGLARRLSEIMLQAGVSQLREWDEQSLVRRLSINLSPIAVDRLDIPDTLETLVENAGILNDRIVFEITENGMGINPITLLEVTARFRLKGFGLSVDDYGKGDSTLDQLRRLPFSELKLDRSLIASAGQDVVGYAILETGLDLAQRLKLPVVVEGIEDAEQFEMVKKLGCEMAQGYFIGRPMPAGQVPEWCRQWQGRPN